MGYVKRFIGFLLCSFVVLELFFVLRIAVMNFVPTGSTAFERTAAVELLMSGEMSRWRHEWQEYKKISVNVKRAVIASEDSRFDSHYGVEWEAIWSAWQHNKKVEQSIPNKTVREAAKRARGGIRGGSTITQQLAKNLFLSTEQTYLRKAQELFITLALEALLPKDRLLELYLNHAEWGTGIYGVQAAAQIYFKTSASDIGPQPSATLAALLPRPRYYEQHRDTPYLRQRARSIMAGLPVVSVP